MRGSWRICCASATCRGSGVRARNCGNCGTWFAIGSSWRNRSGPPNCGSPRCCGPTGSGSLSVGGPSTGSPVRNCEAIGTQGQWVVGQLLEEIEHLQKLLVEVEARLTDLTSNDAFVQKLLEYPGIGLVTAVTLKAELGPVRRFRSGKQLSRFCALSPRNTSSGLKQADAGLINAGNPQLRTVLIEAAHRLQRCDLRWAELGMKLRRQGKPGSVVAAAVANRWVRWLYHQLLAV